MKKILVLAMAVAAISLASCGNKTAEPAETTDTVAETTAANVAAQSLFDQIKNSVSDPAKLQLAVGTAQAKIQEFLSSGDTASVNQYTKILQDLISGDTTVKEALQNVKNSFADAAGGTKGSLLDAFNAVVGAATEKGATAASFLEATKKAGTSALTDSAVKAAAEAAGVTEAATEAAEAAKTAVENAPEAVKDAATQAANDAKAKAEEAVANKVDEGRQKAADAVNKAAEKANEKVNEAAEKGLKKLGL